MHAHDEEEVRVAMRGVDSSITRVQDTTHRREGEREGGRQAEREGGREGGRDR
jgi:hypothetical protein